MQLPLDKLDALEHFRARISIDPETGCWHWQGATQPRGYGTMPANGQKGILAHRFAYETFIGPIPDGHELDHLCRNRSCVNPAHLEPVTHSENVRRGNGAAFWRNKTQCPQGHPYDEENTYFDGRGYRRCRACSRRYYQKRDRLPLREPVAQEV